MRAPLVDCAATSSGGQEPKEKYGMPEHCAVPPENSDEQAHIDFAHTCSGYGEFGGPEGLDESVRAIRSEWEEAGTLPDDVLMLRRCLFYEVRSHRHSGGYTPFNEDEFVLDLMSRIRLLSGGSVPILDFR
ncbi:hypothetical protein [Nocardia sp. NPDC058705]|uniref:hypothetical protein n=1 Tax=Nocardia sp. NPDC058705 TaxID=3346609 RepID=UPI0036CC2830